ncbi:hypothetical protein Hamer_G030059 [Homarus americanus]|uniref:Uncharacterized protein n=1 Tax=Homarus americanus TaxID=6706 RepID=A0A8J5JUK1_HOMAM|nr:hypothetical protein Hamer_G030059 [Homarus americanus]
MFLVVRVRKETTKYCAFTSAVTKKGRGTSTTEPGITAEVAPYQEIVFLWVNYLSNDSLPRSVAVKCIL